MSVFLRKYGVAATIDGIPLITRGAVDFKSNPTIATGDVTISKDGGTFAGIATLPTVAPASGTSVQITLSASEMQCARAVVRLIDQTVSKEWEDQEIIVETFGHASAQFQLDLSDAVRAGLTALPGNAAGTSGGLYSPIVHRGTAQSGSNNTIVLDASASPVDNLYKGCRIHPVSGPGSGQTRVIIDYTGSTKEATVDRGWAQNPASTTEYVILTDEAADLDGNLEAQVSDTDQLTIADTVWDEARSQHVISGSFGEALDATVSSRLAGSSYTTPPTTAQIANAIVGKTLTELTSGAPSDTPTLEQALMLLYMALANRLDTEKSPTFLKIYDSAGNVICKAALTDAATGFTRAKMDAP